MFCLLEYIYSIIGIITPPTCALATGSVDISGLPAGNWTLNQAGTVVNSIAGNTLTTTVAGLIAGSYTFTVTNAVGCTSLVSVNVPIPVQPVTPAAPTIGTATLNGSVISVPFTANSDNGSAITGYTVTSSSGRTATGASSPITITKTNGGTSMRDEIKAIKKEQEDARQHRKATSDKLDHMYEVLLDFVARSK